MTTHPLEDKAEVLRNAERLTEATASGDEEAFREMFVPDMVLWHNTDGVEQTLDASVEGWLSLHALFYSLDLTDVSYQITDAGYVQQHTWQMAISEEQTLPMPACWVVSLADDGRVARVDEYMDSTQLAAALEAAENRQQAHSGS